MQKKLFYRYNEYIITAKKRTDIALRKLTQLLFILGIQR